MNKTAAQRRVKLVSFIFCSHRVNQQTSTNMINNTSLFISRKKITQIDRSAANFNFWNTMHGVLTAVQQRISSLTVSLQHNFKVKNDIFFSS